MVAREDQGTRNDSNATDSRVSNQTRVACSAGNKDNGETTPAMLGVVRESLRSFVERRWAVRLSEIGPNRKPRGTREQIFNWPVIVEMCRD